MIIYLRQEGHGIGLTEKIKAYHLQDQGFDTFEANVKLGHLPDNRTYDMLADVFKHLNVSHVKLMTNNPEKSVLLNHKVLRLLIAYLSK